MAQIAVAGKETEVGRISLFLVIDLDPVSVWVPDLNAILVFMSWVFVNRDFVVSEPASPLIHLRETIDAEAKMEIRSSSILCMKY